MSNCLEPLFQSESRRLPFHVNTGGPSSVCEFKMAVNIKDLYGNSGKRFKSINTR